MKNLTITAEYKNLYFEDLTYVLNSLLRTTRNFLNDEELWFSEDVKVKIKNYLKQINITISDEDYYKLVITIKDYVRNYVTYDIIEISSGSMKIKVGIVVISTILAGVLSAAYLPAGITAEMIGGLVMLYYDQNEEKLDKKLDKLSRKWNKRFGGYKRQFRKVVFSIKKE